MNSDYISFEAMLAAREAASSAHWSMIATWIYGISALVGSVATLGAVWVAYKTMGNWRQLEDLKEKKQLKASLVKYRNVLMHMPPQMDPYLANLQELSLKLDAAVNDIYLPLVVLEEDLDEGELGKKFTALFNLHYAYLSCNKSQMDVMKYLAELLAMKIVSNVN